jgi:hypothetical protein
MAYVLLRNKHFQRFEFLITASFMPNKWLICNSKDSIFGHYLHSIYRQEWLIFMKVSF